MSKSGLKKIDENCIASVYTKTLASIVLNTFEDDEFCVCEWYEHPLKLGLQINIKRYDANDFKYSLFFDYSMFLVCNKALIRKQEFLEGLQFFIKKEICKIKKRGAKC